MDPDSVSNELSETESMDSGIEFGQVEHAQPDRGLRPDQDKHFVVAEIGTVKSDDLPIFVDMDVLRDMESHARENTRVELGGVMLGRQLIDDEGNAFVVITDSLRAKHYEATKGSFKFTADTWNQITRDRNEYRSDLEMVGWYHTHPGWGVFLSGMDLFICNNFFSRPLDVALVVEPCAGERGWFQWENGQTRQTKGFFLMSNRHRINELNYFSDIFNNQNPTIADPRFRQASFTGNDLNQGESMVNVIDNRRPVFELAIVSMLFLQLLMAGVFGYRLLYELDGKQSDDLADRVAAVESKLDDDSAGIASIREQAYAEILEKIVSGETGQVGLAEQYASVAEQNRLLAANQKLQLSAISMAESKNEQLARSLDVTKKKAESVEAELRAAQDTVWKITKENSQLKTESGDGLPENKQVLPPWLWYGLGGAALFICGAIGGSLMVRRNMEDDDDSVQWNEAEPNALESDSDISTTGEKKSAGRKVAG